jgi:hypothetical protein
MRTPADDATLAALQRDFPRFRIWLEPTYSQNRFVARRQFPGTGLHTVISKDPAELRAALSAAQASQDMGTQSPDARLPAVPRQRRPT